MTTLSVLYFLLIVALVWEIYTILNKKPGDTISAVTRAKGRVQTAIPLFMGALMRHLWGDDERTKAAFMAGWEAGVWWPCLDRDPTSDTPP